ncbi:MAG: ASKHA domain-containing protein [Desulfobacteraceae bacterium]|jgi:uncharacterized 2Fe-2S/4Fe-4S cluster protein (DUF4445 family)
MKKNKKAKKKRRPYRTPPPAKNKKVNWLNILPDDIWVRVKHGRTIFEALQKTNLDLSSECGGLGTCGKCKVRIVTPIGPAGKQERKLLPPAELEGGIRLACQTRIKKTLVVHSSVQHDAGDMFQILKHGFEQEIEIDPLLDIVPLSLKPPDLHDAASDFNRVRNALGPLYTDLKITHSCLSSLYHGLRSTGFCGEALLHRRCMLAWSPQGSPNGRFGLIFDIGTTTLVGKLIDLEQGRERGVISRLNSQTQYGSNVIRRIQYIRESKKGLQRLRRLLIRDLNAITRRLAEAGGIETQNIFVAVAAGNTTMQHILLGLDPSGIAEAPFVPVVTEGVTFPTRLLELDLNPDAMLYVVPSKSGYIGGDLMAFILSSGVAEQDDKIILGIDLGTNGEIFLGNRNRLLTCSAAAGPAFEGARITHGMIAKSGAIESVYVDHQQLRYRVIGNLNPKGLCGSGLVDLVAVLLHFGVIDPEGLIGPKQIDEAGNLFASRLVRSNESDIHHFLVASPEASFNGRTILLHQLDVRELQLAKGAVAAGIEILMQQLGITAGNIDQVCLAGALGNYVHPLSAMRIGLIPIVDPGKVVTMGNAAAAGAAMALLSKKNWQQLKAIADQVEHVELSLHHGFDEIFVAAMDFPDNNLW